MIQQFFYPKNEKNRNILHYFEKINLFLPYQNTKYI